MDSIMKFGPHRAKAPVTNVTQVKPKVDSMKLLLQTIKFTSIYIQFNMRHHAL